MKRGKVLFRGALQSERSTSSSSRKLIQLQHVSKMQKVADYVKLASVNNFKGKKINCYGILNSIDKEVKSVNSKTNQDQWQIVVTLVDETCVEGQSISCSIFAVKENAMSCIKRRGDILRLHRVSVWEDGMLGGQIGLVGFHAVVWDSEHGGSYEPRGATSVNRSICKNDKERLNELRVWWLRKNGSTRQAKERLSSLTVFAYGDIICQVIAVIVSCRESTVVRVWDGTRISVSLNSLPDHDIVADRSTIDENLVKLAGQFAQDIWCYDDLAKEASYLKPGDILFVQNVHVYKKDRQAVPSLVMHTRKNAYKRGFTVLFSDDFRAQQLLRDLQVIGDRCSVNNGAAASTSAVTNGPIATDVPCIAQPACVSSAAVDSQEEEEVTCSQAPFAILRKKQLPIDEEPVSSFCQSPPLTDSAAIAQSPLIPNGVGAVQTTDNADILDVTVVTRKRKSDADELFVNPLAVSQPQKKIETAVSNNTASNHINNYTDRHHHRVVFDQLIANLEEWKDGEFVSIVDEFPLNERVYDALFPSRLFGQADHLFHVECNCCGLRWRMAGSGLKPEQVCPSCSRKQVSSPSKLRLTVELKFIRKFVKDSAIFLCREPVVKQLIPSFASAEELYVAFYSRTGDKLMVKRFWDEAESVCKRLFSVASAEVISMSNMRLFLVHELSVCGETVVY